MSVVFGGIAVLFFCFAGWIFGIVGFMLGIVSLFRMGRDPYLTGRPMAVTGIALSSLPLGFALYLVVVWLVAVAVPPPPAQPTPFYVPVPATTSPGNSGVAAAQPDPETIFRVHKADWVSPGEIRCTFCGGSGRAPRFGHTGDGTRVDQVPRRDLYRLPGLPRLGQADSRAGAGAWPKGRHGFRRTAGGGFWRL